PSGRSRLSRSCRYLRRSASLSVPPPNDRAGSSTAVIIASAGQLVPPSDAILSLISDIRQGPVLAWARGQWRSRRALARRRAARGRSDEDHARGGGGSGGPWPGRDRR